MDTVFTIMGWIIIFGSVFGLGAWFVRMVDWRSEQRRDTFRPAHPSVKTSRPPQRSRPHQSTPFRHGGYSPTRPPASLVPPSAESSRTAVTPPPGRSDYLVTQILVADLVDLKGAKGLVLQPVGSHKTNPFTPTPQAKRDATRAPADEVARDPNPYRPFSGEEDIQAQIDMFIWEQNK